MADNGKPSNPFDKKTLEEGLNKNPLIGMKYDGPRWSIRCSQFQEEIVDWFNNALGLQSASYCIVFPDKISRDATTAEIKMVMYFYTKDNNDIKLIGGGSKKPNNSNGDRVAIYDVVSRNNPGKRRWAPSKNFVENVTALTDDFDDNGNIIIRSLPNTVSKRGDNEYIAVVELSFPRVMQMILSIDDNSYYDFNYDIVSTRTYQTAGDGMNYDDAIIVVDKYITNNTRKPKRNQRVNYRAFTKDVVNAYSSGGGRR